MAKRSPKKSETSKSAEARYRLFVKAYLANGRNGTAAAITAGYAENSAHAQGSRLLKNAKVRALLDKETARVEKKLDISAERVLQQYAKIAFGDIKDLVTWDAYGRVKLRPMDEVDGTVISELYEVVSENGTRTLRLKTSDRMAALEKLFRHLGLDKQQLNVNMDISLADVLQNAWKQRQRAGGGSDA